MKIITHFIWLKETGFPLLWNGSNFIELIKSPHFERDTIVIGGNKERILQWEKMFHNARTEIIHYKEFFRSIDINHIEEAEILLTESQRLLKTSDIQEHSRFSSAIFHRFSKKIWKEAWNRHHNEDKKFLDAEIHPYSEAKILSSECRTNWEISSIDMNSMFPFILTNFPFMHIGKMQSFLGKPPENSLWFAKCKFKWNPSVSEEDKIWFSKNHPFLYSYEYVKTHYETKLPAIDRRMFFFEMDVNISNDQEFPMDFWIYSEEVDAYKKYILITPVEGIFAPRKDHPLKNSMNWFLNERQISNNELTKNLCKTAANVAASSSFKSPKKWNPWHLKWKLDKHAIQETKGVFSHAVLMKSYARKILFQKIEWFKDNLPEHEICYVNVDAIHFMSPKINQCLETLQASGTVGKEPGQWKIEWQAEHGVWPSARYYWLRNVTFSDGSFQKILHASLDSENPFAKGVTITVNGMDKWMDHRKAWKNSRNHRLHGLHWHRLPLNQAIKRTHSEFPGNKVQLAINRLLKK